MTSMTGREAPDTHNIHIDRGTSEVLKNAQSLNLQGNKIDHFL